MISLSVNLTDLGARSGIAALIAAVEDREGLHDAMAHGVEVGVKAHLDTLNTSRSTRTNFYGKAADSVTRSASAEAGEVIIPHRGIALRYHGGRVTAGANISDFTGNPTKNLALPTDKVPVRNEMRLRPKDAGLLAFIPNRGGPSVTRGYLVEGEEKTITRGPRKGGKRIVPKAGGVMMFVLRGWTDHDPDPSVLPTEGELGGFATSAGADYVDSFMDEGGVA